MQKFGGSSVATAALREEAIRQVVKALEEGFLPVVVVSAMGRTGDPYATDTLIALGQRTELRSDLGNWTF